MIWAWKPLDFVVETSDTKVPLKNSDGSVKKLRVPDGYTPPPPPRRGDDSEDDQQPDEELDPETEPTYEQLRTEFSLGLGGSHGKVGSVYIRVEGDEPLEVFDARNFADRYKHLAYFEVDEEGKKAKFPFIDRWMRDERMDPRYIHDKREKYYWDRFDMFPHARDCPDDVFNLWPGLAAEKVSSDYDVGVQQGLVLLLDHFRVLCDGGAAQYNFLLDILAHTVQYPNTKLGIMLCLVGTQGCGKGHVWEVIERLIGRRACFTTSKP